MKSFVFKTLIANRIHERVRGGYRTAQFLARDMDSVPIQIVGHALLYVDLRGLDALSLALYRAAPIRDVPFEPALTKLFRRIVRPDDTVFDVGANIGLHTLTFSKLAREVIAFEPNPSLVPNLRKTVVNLPNVRLFECCLAEADATVEFHVSDSNHLLSSLAERAGYTNKTLSIEARSIDSLIEEGAIPRPHVLKVDVEGAEMLVFRGADKLFSEADAPRFVVFEELNVPGGPSQNLGVQSHDAAEYLRSKGYSLYIINDDGISPLPDARPPDANLLAAKGDYITLTGSLGSD